MKALKSYYTSPQGQFGFILLLFTCFLTAINFIINAARHEVNLDFATWIYYLVASVGYAFIFASILYLLFYLPLSCISRSYKLPAVVYIIFAILLQIILIVDGFVYNIYDYHLNAAIVELFFKAGTDVFVFDMGLQIKIVLLLLLVAVLPYVLVFRFARQLINLFALKRKSICLISTVLLLLFVFANLTYAWGRKSHNFGIVKSAASIPLFQASILNKILIKWELSQQDDIDKVMFYVPRQQLNYPLQPLETTDSIPLYNVLYIVIDSWNPKAFSREVTPHIAEFSAVSHQFSNHFSSSNATIGSVFGMFYSLPYSYEASATDEKVYPVFFERLKDLNYNIQLFPSANLVLEESVFGGLENINKSTEGAATYQRDINITNNAIHFLENQNNDKPFFAFLFYDAAHAISVPQEYRTQFTPSWSEPNYMALNNNMDATPFFNLYKNCIYFIDGQIGKVLHELENKDMLKNTIVIITGDHGQEFNETQKNNWGHFSNYSDWQIKIPFILYHPKIEEGKTFTHTTTHYDLVPTLMEDFLGVKNKPFDYAIGENLYDTISRYPFWSGDFYIRTSLVFEDVLTTVEHSSGVLSVTDRSLNPLPRTTIEDRKDKFIKAEEQKERFYKSLK